MQLLAVGWLALPGEYCSACWLTAGGVTTAYWGRLASFTWVYMSFQPYDGRICTAISVLQAFLIICARMLTSDGRSCACTCSTACV